LPNRVLTLRSSTPGARPTGRSPGELYCNFADGVVGYIDDTGTPIDLKGGSVTIADVAPTAPDPGDMWFDSVSCQLFVSYDDGTSQQWVIAVNAMQDLSAYVTQGDLTTALGDYLPLTGGDLTGPLTGTDAIFSSMVSAKALIADGPAGDVHGVYGKTGGLDRWAVFLGDQTPEANFVISRYDDAGGGIDYPLTISRASGAASFQAGATFINGINVQGPGVTSTGFNTTGGCAVGFLNVTGGADVAGSVTGGNLDSRGWVSIASSTKTGFQLIDQGGQFNVLQWSANWHIAWQGSDGTTTFVNNGAIALSIGGFTLDMRVFSANAFKVGGGPWADSSDARIKTVTGDYALGLDQVLQLRPVTYTYLGNDTPTADLVVTSVKDVQPHSGPAPYPASPHHKVATDQKQFVGLVAQDVEAIFPGMVTQKEGYIDGQKVTDLRDLDTNELLYALVNSVKELSARLAALEGAR
jgi:hypothetical protein